MKIDFGCGHLDFNTLECQQTKFYQKNCPKNKRKCCYYCSEKENCSHKCILIRSE